MKAIAINGSPRKGWNTEKLLNEALKGAASAGAETKMFHLYDLNYRGCISCFGCKRKGHETHRCIVKDGLTPVLDELFESDAVFLGTPIYFGDLSGQMVCLIERLGFPLLSYDDYGKMLFDGKINAAMFFTMNAPEAFYNNSMKDYLENRAGILKRLGGTVETYAACDTYQFPDYEKYHSGTFDARHKRDVRETQFPKDLQAAYEIGKRLMRQ